jgi:hypothetical protein
MVLAANETGFDYAAIDRETRGLLKQRATEIRDRMGRTVQTAVEIGDRLIEVRGHLRAADGGGAAFAAWVGAEFQWSRSMAYRFISVAEKFGGRPASQIGTIATSALYLLAADSTPDDVREHFLAAAAGGEPVTHAAVKGQIAEAREQAAAPPEPPPASAPPERARAKAEAAPQRVKARRTTAAPSPAATPGPPAPVVDRVGNAIGEPAIADVFARQDELRALMRQVSDLKSAVVRGIEARDRLFSYVDPTQFRAAADNLREALKFAEAYALCPYHSLDRVARKGCKACGGRGWLPKDKYDRVEPRLREAQVAAQAKGGPAR